jgi:hypothetical protein
MVVLDVRYLEQGQMSLRQTPNEQEINEYIVLKKSLEKLFSEYDSLPYR